MNVYWVEDRKSVMSSREVRREIDVESTGGRWVECVIDTDGERDRQGSDGLR
jgi:hypothetical protein